MSAIDSITHEGIKLRQGPHLTDFELALLAWCCQKPYVIYGPLPGPGGPFQPGVTFRVFDLGVKFIAETSEKYGLHLETPDDLPVALLHEFEHTGHLVKGENGCYELTEEGQKWTYEHYPPPDMGVLKGT